MPSTLIAQEADMMPAEANHWENGIDDINLDALEVSASISSLQSAKATRIVDVITRVEIAALPASSITDLLKLASSVDVRQRTGFGVQSDIRLMGGSLSYAHFHRPLLQKYYDCANIPQPGLWITCGAKANLRL